MTMIRVTRTKPFHLAIAATAIAIGATLAAEASAGDRHRGRREARVDAARDDLRDARAYDRRLDRRGEAIDRQLDLFAFVAAATGDWILAERLDRKGDRIERRLDRRGDRALRNARSDLRDARVPRGHGQGHRHDHATCRDRRHDHFDRRDRDRSWKHRSDRHRHRDRSWKRDRDRNEKRHHDREWKRRDDRKRERDLDRKRERRHGGRVSRHPASIGDDIAHSVRLGRAFNQ